MEQDFSMHANPLVAKLQKPASEFTKADIVSYIKENGITMVNFMYISMRYLRAGSVWTVPACFLSLKQAAAIYM